MRDALFPPILLVLGVLSIRRGVRMLRADVARWAARRLAVIRRTDMREWYRCECDMRDEWDCPAHGWPRWRQVLYRQEP